MACKKPFIRGTLQFGCGQCLGCKIVKKKTWKHRIMLETGQHAMNSFLTLTYSDEHIPKGGTLDPNHTKRFLNTYRKALKRKGYGKIRYYLVGEYGDQTQRPHYHAAIFGVGCIGSNPRYYQGKKCKCEICRITEDAWGYGFIGNGTLENDSASYIAGYVQKTVKVDGKAIMGLTNTNDPLVRKWLKGRHPEFTRMSLKPGIGGNSVGAIVDTLTSDYGSDYVAQNGDVPLLLTHGQTVYPIGRYLRERIRENYGFEKKTSFRGTVSYAPEDSMLKLSAENIEKQKKIHDKAEKIGKDPYKYEKEIKMKRIKEQQIRAQMGARPKGEI